MKKIIALTFVLAMTGATLVLPPATAAAYTCGVTTTYEKDSAGKDVKKQVPIETSIDFTMGGAFGGLCSASNASPITAMLLWAISILGVGVGIAVVIGIVLGGITYAMSDGEAGRVKEAKDKIVNAIIALFLFLFGYAAINFLVPGGLFNGSTSAPAASPTTPKPKPGVPSAV